MRNKRGSSFWLEGKSADKKHWFILIAFQLNKLKINISYLCPRGVSSQIVWNVCSLFFFYPLEHKEEHQIEKWQIITQLEEVPGRANLNWR